MITINNLKINNPKLIKNVSIVNQYQSSWDQQNNKTCGIYEPLLNNVIANNPTNTNFLAVLHKCLLINTLYSTRISKLDLTAIANGIVNTKNFDYLLNHDPDITKAVDVIKNLTSRRNYAFATKYCALHLCDRFPIYDSLSVNTLQHFQDKDHFYSQGNFDIAKASKDYGTYVDIYKTFITSYLNGTSATYREVDKYLWTYEKIKADGGQVIDLILL